MSNKNVLDSSLEPAMGLYIEPQSNRAVIPLHWAKRALTGRSGHTDWTLDSAFGPLIYAMCHSELKLNHQITTAKC